jgi:hypothetical protein
MTGDDIKTDVQATLVDAGIRWSTANLLLWINAGGRDIASNKPKAVTARQNIQLAANVTKQPMPAGVVQVLDLYQDMGADGLVPGRSISVVLEERLRAARPGWRIEKGTAVKHLVQDDRDPTSFNVWPAPSATRYVEALVQKQYVPIVALANALPLDDTYRNPLGDYVLSCAFAMEGADQNASLAAAYYAKYAAGLGMQIKQQKRAAATTNSAENPAHPAVDKNGA